MHHEFLNKKSIKLLKFLLLFSQYTMENPLLPPELSAFIDSENIDFAVKAGRAYPLNRAFFFIGFWSFWNAITWVCVLAFLWPLFFGNEVHIEINGIPTVVSPDNIEPIIVPAIMLWIFVLIWMWFLYAGIYVLLKKWWYFVGTSTRFIHFQQGKIRSIDWEQFSWDIEISGNNSKGNISLKLKTGTMVSRENGPDRYVPDVIDIVEIPNAFEVEKICRRRIKENDPTPA